MVDLGTSRDRRPGRSARRDRLDVVVVGAGPNGLAAAITVARAGFTVQLIEAGESVGGGCRSAALTLPGFVHDVCSAVHPLCRTSPFFAMLPLELFGLRWLEPDIQIAHPLDDGTAIVVRDIGATAQRLGGDAGAYAGLVSALVRDWGVIASDLLGPLRIPRTPRALAAASRLGLHAIRSVTGLANRFRTPAARALLAGCGAHSMLSLSEPISGAFGLLLLASAHAVGWPIAQGGSQRIADALAAHLVELGGTIVTGQLVSSMDALPPHAVTLLDLGPHQILHIAEDRLRQSPGGERYVNGLRGFRYGPGVFKVDLALDGAIPWRDSELRRAGTVHLGGTLEEIAAAEEAVMAGRVAEQPFVLLAQPSILDSSRAPEGQQAVWAYCHVPNGSTVDMVEPILRQIERFAPGVRDRILAVSARGPSALERDNPNYVGGDIAGGRMDLRQFLFRPVMRADPYRTADPNVLVCSSSTPPGAGVHGLCGWYAAQSALQGPLRR